MNTEEWATREKLQIGDTIDDRYELQSVLGKGGYGVVYQAIQKSTNQVVALKVLRADRIRKDNEDEANLNEIARFEREMKLIGKLNHPNIVRLIDFGTLDDERVYTVIEYVEGIDLSELLDQEGALRPHEAKYLMSQVLEALGAAHLLGIVYRDLKPQNIMVTTSGIRRGVKLLDFGISALLEDVRDEDYEELTQDGKINGTPAYMAPEQLRMQPLTQATDIYSWGLVFLETLLGNKAVSSDSYVEILAEQISKSPIKIPEELKEQPLGQILAKAVHKDLQLRYATIHDVMLDLEDCIVPPAMTLSTTGDLARRRIQDSLSMRKSRHNTDSRQMSLWSGDISGDMSGQVQANNPPVPVAPPLDSTHDSQTSPKTILALALIVFLLLGIGVMVFLMNTNSSNTVTDERAAQRAPVQTNTETPTPPREYFTVSVQTTPPDANIFIDGTHRARGGLSVQIPKDAQDHTIEVKAAGFAPRTFTFNNAPPPGSIVLSKLQTHEEPQAKEPKTEEPKLSENTTPTPRSFHQKRTVHPKKTTHAGPSVATPVKTEPEPEPPKPPTPTEPVPKNEPTKKAPKEDWNIKKSDLKNPWDSK